MNGKSRFLGLIPARGGSKRLPRKNLRLLGGKPLIVWTIEAALESRCLDRVIVSTDDPEIATVAREAGAEVPFLRPAALADDHAPGLEVLLHALRTLAAARESYDYLVELQPTSPLRNAGDIRAAVSLVHEKAADAVISVCPTGHPPEWSNTLPPDGALRDFFRPGVRGTRSQDLPPAYRLNGAIHIFNCQRLLQTESTDMDDNGFAYVMPRERSIDIDTALDLYLAQALLEFPGRARSIRPVPSDRTSQIFGRPASPDIRG